MNSRGLLHAIILAALAGAPVWAAIQAGGKPALPPLQQAGKGLDCRRPELSAQALEGLYDAARKGTGPRFLDLGPVRVDWMAPGAHALLGALKHPEPRAVLGMFVPSTRRVVNAFTHGSNGVVIHVQALPEEHEYDPADIGGYTFKPAWDGSYELAHSGSVFSPITPGVERAVLRYLGVRPAGGSVLQRLWRAWLEGFDWLYSGMAALYLPRSRTLL